MSNTQDAEQSTINFVVLIEDLKLADHIYHQVYTMWRQHHGIISYIPKKQNECNENTIRVITMRIQNDINEIEEITLKKFLNGCKLRRVRYQVDAWYESTYISGSCYRQIKSKPQTIIERCNAIKIAFNEINSDFFSTDSLHLTELTHQHFGFWCVTGIVHSTITKTKIGKLLEEIEDTRLGVRIEEFIKEDDQKFEHIKDIQFYNILDKTSNYNNEKNGENNCNEEVEEKESSLFGKIKNFVKNFVEIQDLNMGDHIYRDQYKYDFIFLQHHGIVTNIPLDNRNEEITLGEFLEGKKLYRVEYGVSSTHKYNHIRGTYNEQPKDDAQIIMERCNKIKQRGTISGIESLILVDNKNFALYCCTGNAEYLVPNEHTQIAKNVSGKKVPAIGGRRMSTDMISYAESGVKSTGQKFVSTIISKAGSKAVIVGNKMSTLMENTGGSIVGTVGDTTTDLVKEATKKVMTPTAFGCCIGLSFVVEIGYSAWRIHKYRNDVNILWEDTKHALIKGITNTVAVSLISTLIFAFTATNPAGWAFLAGIGTMALVWGLFKICHEDKSKKEKIFKERGLKLESSIKEKQAEIRLINRQMKDERLHDDKWTDLPHKYVIIYKLKQFDITIKCNVDEDGDEKENGAVIDTVQMSQWIKGIRSGMIVYSINSCNVIDDTFEEIKETFDALLCENNIEINIGLFDPKKVEKEKAKRSAKFIWLESVKKLIKEDIYECRTKKSGKKVIKKTQKPSSPLAITL